MLIDLDDKSQSRGFGSDVCILGAGIAGLILAHKLASRGFSVSLVEGGGLEIDSRSQSLFDAQMAGDLYTGATQGRFRVFGGSSTRWGGQLLPYTDDVFSPGPGMPSSPWPIGQQAIQPYYAEVLRIMGVNALPFDADLLNAIGRPLVGFGDGVRLRFSKWASFSRRNLASSLGRECIAHPNVNVFLHANAMALDPDISGHSIGAVTAKNYLGTVHKFVARHFCLCLGTIESSRLLLASRGHRGIALGNQYDQVGRYFHDHVGMRAAIFEGAPRNEMIERLGPFFVEETLHTCKLEASPALRDATGLPAVMAHVVIEEPDNSGVAAVRNILQSIQQGRFREAIKTNAIPALRGIGDVSRLFWASRVLKRRAVSSKAGVYLNIDVEQVPTADDRIRLANERDSLGQKKAIVDWRIGQRERGAAHRYAHSINAELERFHLAPTTWMPGVLDQAADAARVPMVDTFHPMGGLRMGDDPHSSVVDRELRLHSTENVHIASCAVFPSGGSSNPTFTLMALTLRLADRLTTLLGASATEPSGTDEAAG